jgi:hypothetical protein
MKSWRETINISKIKQEELNKEKMLKGGNNKNLVFLTSEIFKKERIGLNLIDNQYKKMT